MANILVVGAAGFIGSHMVKMLLSLGHEVVSFDNLSSGHRDAVLGGRFVLGDLADHLSLDKLFDESHFDGVMQFASSIQVGESVRDPSKYYRNNLVNTLNLLDAMVRHDVRHLVFSSSAAVFGEPCAIPINESHPLCPLTPYGQSKLMVERILADYDHAYGLKSVSLRYFNAAGADPDGLLGERHDPETHLIPLALRAALGHIDRLTIFGNDYATPDGTCIRDYVHVEDLCHAHRNALEYLFSGAASDAFNLGNGQGFSVQEVLKTVEEVTARRVPANLGSRRSGDPARLVADSDKAKTLLHWSPKHADLRTIISHAWQWEMRSLAI
ncbi:MAG: UDP-glucose 4-epimerase GalE [Sulfuricella sp.]|nr:UDP-glucose 4-epimerase GalE [Sulfuricella sp.]